MHRLIAFAACLVSCASGSQYQRGAPAAPAPAFSPTRAAPHTVGQPGWEPPEYPRGGSRRVLPETPATRHEPGLWGSEPPTAQAGTFPKLLEVPIPVPPDMSRDLGYLSVVNGCAYLLDMAVDGVGLREQAQDLDTNARRCLVARLQTHCTVKIRDHFAGRDIFNPVREKQKRAAKDAEEFKKEACRGVNLDGFPDHIFGMVSRRWDREFERVIQ